MMTIYNGKNVRGLCGFGHLVYEGEEKCSEGQHDLRVVFPEDRTVTLGELRLFSDDGQAKVVIPSNLADMGIKITKELLMKNLVRIFRCTLVYGTSATKIFVSDAISSGTLSAEMFDISYWTTTYNVFSAAFKDDLSVKHGSSWVLSTDDQILEALSKHVPENLGEQK